MTQANNNLPVNKTLSPAQARALLWQRGLISDLVLDATQKEIRNRIFDLEADRQIWTIVYARQCGKSVLALTLAVEACLRTPNFSVLYVAPRLNQAKAICSDAFEYILRSCPESLKPKFSRDNSTYEFPNGSKIRLGGVNAKEIDSLRGGKSHMVIADECGFMQEFKKAVKGALYPRLNITKGVGKLILISTLPSDPGHEFFDYVKTAEYRGTLIKKSIRDCPRYTEQDILRFADEAGGIDSVEFKREYLNIIIPDEEYTVIPEFNDESMEDIVCDLPKPAYYDCYVSMDIGLKDLTAILFAFYDFRNGYLYIEDEVGIKGRSVTTRAIASSVEEKESNLWGYKKPYIRVADNNNLILLNDLNIDYGVYFRATAKDNKHAQINELRVLIEQGKIRINPRCQKLILHLKTATWKPNHKDYTRDPDGNHFDFLDALIYMARNVNWFKNPYPANYAKVGGSYMGDSGLQFGNSFEEHLKDIFQIKSRKN